MRDPTKRRSRGEIERGMDGWMERGEIVMRAGVLEGGKSAGD